MRTSHSRDISTSAGGASVAAWTHWEPIMATSRLPRTRASPRRRSSSSARFIALARRTGSRSACAWHAESDSRGSPRAARRRARAGRSSTPRARDPADRRCAASSDRAVRPLARSRSGRDESRPELRSFSVCTSARARTSPLAARPRHGARAHGRQRLGSSPGITRTSRLRRRFATIARSRASASAISRGKARCRWRSSSTWRPG